MCSGWSYGGCEQRVRVEGFSTVTCSVWCSDLPWRHNLCVCVVSVRPSVTSEQVLDISAPCGSMERLPFPNPSPGQEGRIGPTAPPGVGALSPAELWAPPRGLLS